MLHTKTRRALLLLGTVLGCISLLSAVSGCGGGDTDGGPAVDANDRAGAQFVSDTVGGSLRIRVVGPLTVTGEVGFTVTALDPSGAPLQFIRIFCESERGIAIIEPSAGGVAFEHTDETGVMSGRLGGLVPGSFLLECRGPVGFGLVDRLNITIRGSVPDGFIGFPGAAGGNLGGDSLIDITPDADEMRISEIQFRDAGWPQ